MTTHTNTEISTILVIEDDTDCQQLAETLLLSVGYKVLIAGTGAEAKASLSHTIPELILLDLSLPDMNGLDIAKYLMSQHAYSDIPIVIMSADDTENAIEEAYQYNVYDYIVKPINAALFIKKVNATLFTHTIKNELALNEQRLSKVQQLGGIGSWVYRRQRNTFNCSDQLSTLLDKGDSELGFDEFLSCIHKGERGDFKDKLLNAIEKGIPFTVEHSLVSSDDFDVIVIHSVSGEIDKYKNQFILTGTVMDITERINDQELISYTQFHDRITGLPNHENFCNRLNTLITEIDKNEKLIGVLMIGVDRFKNINEALGREVGDKVLQALAERFSKYENAEAFRYAGDIFSIIIKDMSNVYVLEKISENIFASLVEPLIINGDTVYLSVSIGSAIYPMVSGGKNDLISAVESAMYQAKRIGGDRAVYFDIKHYKSMKNNMLLEVDIRKAMDNNEFEVYYQPQVSVADCKLVGMEALLRWKHPEYGFVNPEQFIPIAEEIGLIFPLGHWVMETAIKQVTQWFNQGYGLMRVGVNISPYQFENKNLFRETVDLVEKYGMMPCALDIEITESAAMRDVEQTISVLTEFTDYGIQSSMDDFGTGYSSLSYLKQMPLHTIKIDKSFILDINKTEENGELAKIIIAMSHSLGRNVIAEGVENEAHLNFLRKYKCAEAQGYYFSRAVPAEQFEDFFINPAKYNMGYNKPDDDDSLLFSEPQIMQKK